MSKIADDVEDHNTHNEDQDGNSKNSAVTEAAPSMEHANDVSSSTVNTMDSLDTLGTLGTADASAQSAVQGGDAHHEASSKDRAQDVSGQSQQQPDDADLASPTSLPTAKTAVERTAVAPFLVRIFMSKGKPFDKQTYAGGSLPSDACDVFCWTDTSLREILVVAGQEKPELVAPRTRVGFRVIARTAHRLGNHYTRDLGTVFSTKSSRDDTRTLDDRRFVIGDFIELTYETLGGGGRRGSASGGSGFARMRSDDTSSGWTGRRMEGRLGDERRAVNVDNADWRTGRDRTLDSGPGGGARASAAKLLKDGDSSEAAGERFRRTDRGFGRDDAGDNTQARGRGGNATVGSRSEWGTQRNGRDREQRDRGTDRFTPYSRSGRNDQRGSNRSGRD
ncbi:Sin3 associated polypeptide p18-domain-containing protein [Entophlyctis helioformis]|nr:Sin3 associated polypeptide p18-domain-containing protein [Entophlyctis helioformis]